MATANLGEISRPGRGVLRVPVFCVELNLMLRTLTLAQGDVQVLRVKEKRGTLMLYSKKVWYRTGDLAKVHGLCTWYLSATEGVCKLRSVMLVDYCILGISE